MGTPAQAPPQGQPMAQPGYAYQPAPAGYGQAPPQGWSQPPMMAAPRPMNWDMLAFVFRLFGFFLIAIGALVVVAMGYPPSGCFASPPSNCTTPGVGIVNALVAGRILVGLGALLLGIGAGIKLHWVLRAPADPASSSMAWVLVERLVNYAIILVAIGLFWFVMTSSSPAYPSLGAGGL